MQYIVLYYFIVQAIATTNKLVSSTKLAAFCLREILLNWLLYIIISRRLFFLFLIFLYFMIMNANYYHCRFHFFQYLLSALLFCCFCCLVNSKNYQKTSIKYVFYLSKWYRVLLFQFFLLLLLKHHIRDSREFWNKQTKFIFPILHSFHFIPLISFVSHIYQLKIIWDN